MPTTGNATDVIGEKASPLHAVDSWCRVRLARSSVADEVRCADFPYRPVAAHWQARGRAGADTSTVRLVDDAAALLTGEGVAGTAPGPGTWAWFLRQWLPSLTDIQRGECSYATYVGLPVIFGLVKPQDGETEPLYPPEAVATALLGLLLAFEVQARRWGAAPAVSPRRIVVIGNALAQHRGPFLTREDVAPVWPPNRAGGEVQAAAQLAARVEFLTPRPLYDFLDLLAVPATTVHDEVMFLRTLQLFETVFAAMLGDVEQARDALERGEDDAGAALLDTARSRLARSMPFFRILGTMPRSSFTDIRIETPGASGLQSESFKRIELFCARQNDDRLASPGDTEPDIAALAAAHEARPTIEELARTDGVLSAMRSLDQVWLQWKKTYWAIEARLVGGVPGTGGTDGAAHLEPHISGSLFPVLAR